MEKIILLIALCFFLATENVYSIEPKEEALVYTLEEVQKVINSASQIKVLDLKWEGETLFVNLSKEVVAYGGGNTTEFLVGQLILEWAFNYTDAKAVTLLVEGQADAFPEGSDFSDYTRTNYQQNTSLREATYEENNICNNQQRESKGN